MIEEGATLPQSLVMGVMDPFIAGELYKSAVLIQGILTGNGLNSLDSAFL